jgi:adhesin HecA-like repeat protein
MKKKILHIVCIWVIFQLSGALLFSQGVSIDNSGGKLKNNGTIRVKAGQVKNLPSVIDGRVEFSATCPNFVQEVPNIQYNQLVMQGAGLKVVKDYLPNSPLIVNDSLLIQSEARVEINSLDIYTKKTLLNTAIAYGIREIRLNGSERQTILGAGKYDRLNVDNPAGVAVQGGGFTIEKKLTMTNGKINNDQNNNFSLADSVEIERYAESELAYSPDFKGAASVTYSGSKIITSGYEIPVDSTKLLDLTVNNSGGIVLNKNITVNRYLNVSDRILTEPDALRRFILTYTPAFNPNFSNSPFAEIEGVFRRTDLLMDSTKILFNNRFTWALFRNAENGSGIKALNFRIKPRSFFTLPDGQNSKVKRTTEIWAENSNKDTVKMVTAVDIGYAWRYEPNDTLDENLGLPTKELKLKRWSGLDWQDISSSSQPQFSEDSNWVYANATQVDLLGQFTVGLTGGGQVTLAAKVFLEGPYSNKRMSVDLAKYSLLAKTPDDVYPYNLDADRTKRFASITLDSIVDWIVLEFKRDGGVSKFISCLLRNDGVILSPDGDTIINLSKMGVDSGEYYIGILHRNHLPIYTSEKYKITPDYNGQMADFTKHTNIYGKTASLKALDIIGGFVLYGMVAGDVDGDNDIDENDYLLTWQNRDLQFRYSRYDINMSGYVNTKDMNFPWNNLGRSSSKP